MFLDIGIGVLLSYFLGNMFDIPVTNSLVGLGVIFALFPDVDMFLYAAKRFIKKKVAYNHRSFTHYPIIYIPITIGVYFATSLPIATLFFLCVYAHLIHDTFWIGWGIRWFWPFSKRTYKFFPDKDGKISSQILMTWEEKDEEQTFATYNNPNWIRDFYCKPNIVAYVEYTVLIIAVVYFILHR